jgi:hypothetical protein
MDNSEPILPISADDIKKKIIDDLEIERIKHPDSDMVDSDAFGDLND